MLRRNHSSHIRHDRRPSGRRALRPPECLESRIAPGALLYSFPAAEFAADKPLGAAAIVSSSADGSGRGNSSPASKSTTGQTNSAMPTTAAADSAIELLLGGNTAGKSGQLARKATAAQKPESPALLSINSTVAGRVSAPVAASLKSALPSVKNADRAEKNANQDVSAKPAATPALNKTPPPSSAGGGSAVKGGGGAASSPKATTKSPASPQTNPPAQPTSAPVIQSSVAVLSTANVQTLLDAASAATPRNDAIIAVVDRNGTILGVRVEDGVSLTGDTLVFAIDGAVAKARTAAYFSSDQAPLTSRTVRFISQTTITEREVESNPNIPDKTSTLRGPGFVAPIGIGGHFPPGVQFTPHVDLFAIEHTNRDGVIHPGLDLIRGTSDDVNLGTRFGADFDMGQEIAAPESYGKVSGLLPDAQSRGIATLPGGIPLFNAAKNTLLGGIGVFFPGPDGYATFEQNFQDAAARRALGLKPQTTDNRLNAPLVLTAEYTALVAAQAAGLAPPDGRIDLVGITLEIIGPHPNGKAGLVAFGRRLGPGTVNGTDQQVNTSGDTLLAGQLVPDGWLVSPQAGTNISAAEVQQIIERGVAEAQGVRAAIRLPLGRRTEMVLSVTDTDGEILGLFRMPDATFFSIDVAVAKARNVAYYADAADLQPADQVAGVSPGVAFTNRTFRYLASPFFPTGVDGAGSGQFSTLNDPGVNPKTAENNGPALPADQYNSVLGFDAFNPGSNFRELSDSGVVAGNQNGIVFFPGSTPLYKNGTLIGGLGVSGDGVDQDDVVTFAGGGQFIPSPGSGIVRSDQVFVRGVRLPYQKFNRNPRG